MRIGNIDFNPQSSLTKKEFQTLYKGKLGMPVNEAWELYKKRKAKK